MTVVYKAEHSRTRRVVALKQLPRIIVPTSESIRLLRQQLEVLGQLRHPQLVVPNDVYESHGQAFLVMEFVDGVNLASKIREKGPLDVQEAVKCAYQTARAMHFAHHYGIVHHELKPSNLMQDTHATIRILGLGQARLAPSFALPNWDNAAKAAIPEVYHFLSPEQTYDRLHADARSDIYSLGCTLWFLLTGEYVFKTATRDEALLAHRERAAPSIRGVRADVPAWLDEILQRMLRKSGVDRFPTMVLVQSISQNISAG